MKIVLEICGMLREKFPFDMHAFDLPEHSTVNDLIRRIDGHVGSQLPGSVWNREKKFFRGPITLSIDGVVITDYSIELKENQHIKCNRFLIGG